MLQARAHIPLLLLVATLVVGSSGSRIHEPDDYLPRADAQPLGVSPFLQETLAAIVKHPLPAASSDEMLSIIKSTLDKSNDLKEMDFFEELYNLSRNDGKCTPNLRRYVLAIFTLAHETSEPAVKTYINYLKSTIPRAKFGQCAQRTGEEFARALERYARRDEQALDKLFSAYDGLTSVNQDEQLYRAAREMDLVRGNYNVPQMLQVSKEILPVGYARASGRAPHDQLALFVHTWCLKMQVPLKNVMAVYNLARALGAQVPTDELPAKFLKLNEYNRVCLTLQKERGPAESIISQQMG